MHDETPSIMSRLKTFDPITLPSASCGFFLQAAMMAVMSSGSEVPTATMVIEITASLMPHDLARVFALSRNRLPPHSRAASDTAAMPHNSSTFLPARLDFVSSSASAIASLGFFPFFRITTAM